jgi:transcriptional regulator with XRE-family HTH domain
MRNTPVPKNTLLDYLIEHLGLKNSRALSKHLGVTQGMISKIRYGVNKPSSDFILLVYGKTNLSIEKIRELIGEDNGLDS